MEQSEGYKKLEAKLQAFEQQLPLCDKANKVCERSGKDAEKDIEEHFAKCMNALAERKAALLREVARKVANQSIMHYDLFLLFILHVFIIREKHSRHTRKVAIISGGLQANTENRGVDLCFKYKCC